MYTCKQPVSTLLAGGLGPEEGKSKHTVAWNVVDEATLVALILRRRAMLWDRCCKLVVSANLAIVDIHGDSGDTVHTLTLAPLEKFTRQAKRLDVLFLGAAFRAGWTADIEATWVSVLVALDRVDAVHRSPAEAVILENLLEPQFQG